MISRLVQTFLVLDKLEEDPQGWMVQDCTMIGNLFGWFNLALVQGLLWLNIMPNCQIARRKLAWLDWWLVQGLSKVCHHGPWSHKGVREQPKASKVLFTNKVSKDELQSTITHQIFSNIAHIFVSTITE